MLFQLILVPCLLARFGKKGLRALAARSENASFWTSLMIWVNGGGWRLPLFFNGGAGRSSWFDSVESGS